MESQPAVKRAYYNYLSRAYSLFYTLSRRSFLGVSVIALARWLPILVLLIGWMQGWPTAVLLALLTLIVWFNYSLWRAKRSNYNRFVPDAAFTIQSGTLEPLPHNQKVTVQATGLFSVSGRETNLLLRPADYWRVPLGEHVVMAEERPAKFLYQFFNPESLQTIRRGWLLFGAHPIETLAVTFLAQWGPEYTRFGQSYELGDNSDLPPPKKVTIYLSASSEEVLQSIWHTIVHDARQSRLKV